MIYRIMAPLALCALNSDYLAKSSVHSEIMTECPYCDSSLWLCHIWCIFIIFILLIKSKARGVHSVSVQSRPLLAVGMGTCFLLQSFRPPGVGSVSSSKFKPR